MSIKDFSDLRAHLKIDKYALDDEIVEHPTLLAEISELCALAIAERDMLKEKWAAVDAGIDLEVRAQSTGKKKLTEGHIKSIIQMHPDHIKSGVEYLQKRAEADQLQALKEAFHQRGYMLRDLAQLFVSNYYSTSSVRATPNTEETVYRVRRSREKHG